MTITDWECGRCGAEVPPDRPPTEPCPCGAETAQRYEKALRRIISEEWPPEVYRAIARAALGEDEQGVK